MHSNGVIFNYGLLGPLSGPLKMKLNAQSSRSDDDEDDYGEDYQNGETITLHLQWEVSEVQVFGF